MEPKTNRFVDCNAAAIEIYGYKNKKEVIGKTPLDVSTKTQYNGELSSTETQANIKAIENETDNEIKTFLIRRLAFCGTNTSVDYLSKFLSDDNLFEPSLATLTYIGTAEAAEAVLKARADEDEIL